MRIWQPWIKSMRRQRRSFCKKATRTLPCGISSNLWARRWEPFTVIIKAKKNSLRHWLASIISNWLIVLRTLRSNLPIYPTSCSQTWWAIYQGYACLICCIMPISIWKNVSSSSAVPREPAFPGWLMSWWNLNCRGHTLIKGCWMH